MMNDENRVLASTPSHMERGMLKVLAAAQGAIAEGGDDMRVCGLSVAFSHEGHAHVSWDVRVNRDEEASESAA